MVYTFNGTSNYIKIPSTPQSQLQTFTLAVWFKTSKNYVPDEDGGEGMMITKGGWISDRTGEQLSYGIWVSDANHLRGGFETTDGTDNILTTSGTKVNTGTWRHGALTYDKQTLIIYLDGQEFKRMSTTSSPEKNNQPLVIGKNPLSYRTGYFKGELHSPRVYNRALSAAEITTLYTKQSEDLILGLF